MLQEFKFLVLCLISVCVSSYISSWLCTCVLFFTLAFIFHDYHFGTGLRQHAIIKVRHLYLKVRTFYFQIVGISQSNQEISDYTYSPAMNNINRHTPSFDLSRFNNSGNPVSPITASSSNPLASRRLIQSRQTSTPLTRTTPWQKTGISPSNHRTQSYPTVLNSSRSPRYALASETASKSSYESPSRPTIQTVTGPLLASTRFNVNLGTYTDTKSPGLASRVVQYHNDLSGNQTSTHQIKYGSPGQFPLVQLYKKELPLLAQTPKRCTVRIAPPDSPSYNSNHANTILRDSFVQTIEQNGVQSDTEINTRSVLEALTEISRKRIHSNDDLNDISKRQRKDTMNASTSNTDFRNKDGKRMREDTPPKSKDLNSSPSSSTAKRICVVNEIESSLSSSRPIFFTTVQKRKSSSAHSSTNIQKQRRIANGILISRKTQTHINNGKPILKSPSRSPTQKLKEVSKQSTSAQTEAQDALNIANVLKNNTKKAYDDKNVKDIDNENATLGFKNPTSNSQIFNEEPLAIARNNKLEIMLACIGGDNPKITPLPEISLSGMKNQMNNSDSVDSAKVIPSILSPTIKNKGKHDKHVTFNIPEEDKESNETEHGSESSSSMQLPGGNSIPAIFSQPDSVNVNITSSTNNLSSISNPISNSLTNLIQSDKPIQKDSALSVNAIIGSQLNFGLNVANTNITPKTNPPSYNADANTTVSNHTISTPIVSSAKSSDKPINFGSPQIGGNFGPSNTSSSSLTMPAFGGLAPSSKTNNNTNNETLTGFSGTNTTSTPINFGFSKPDTSSVTSLPTFGSSSSSSTGPAPSGFAVPGTTSSISNNQISFATAKPVLAFGSPATTQSSFGSSQTSLFPSTTSTSSFGATSTTSTTAPVSTSTLAPLASGATGSGMFSFGTKTDAKTSANTSATSSSSFTFGPSSTSNLSQPKAGGFKFDIDKPANSPTSKIELPKSNLFGDAKPAAFSFGSSSTSSTSAPAPPAFGATSTTTSAPAFGVTTTTTSASAGVFGAPTTTASTAFGVPNASASSAFGAPSTATGGFGAPTTTASGIFGSTSTPAFGASKPAESTSGFGGFGTPTNATQNTNTGFGNFSTPTTTQSSTAFGGFGATPTQSNNQTSAFGAPTTTSAFAFGSNTTSKPFGFGATTTTTTAPGLFGTTTPATNSTNAGVFGGAPNTAFGASGSTSAFGAPTTTASSTFGTPNPPNQSTSAFGASSSGFGASSGSVFGGTNNNNNAFGATPAPASSSTFGTPNQTASTFGAGATNPPSFGAGTTNQTNAFSATSPNQSTFGASSSSTSAFGPRFGGATVQPSGFGAGGFSASGSQAPAPTPQGGVFAFGGQAPSSSSTPNNAFQFGGATQAPKPSGFNFSGNGSGPNLGFGGSPAPPAFGSGTPTAAPPAFGGGTPTPSFGATSPPFNAQTPSTGMFSIGSGSTAPKQRPMIKARRRN